LADLRLGDDLWDGSSHELEIRMKELRFVAVIVFVLSSAIAFLLAVFSVIDSMAPQTTSWF